MNLVLEIIGWAVLLFTGWFTFLLGQAIFSNSQLAKRNVEVTVPQWINFSIPVIAALFQIFLLKNIWLAVVISAIIGIIAGYIAEYTFWRLGLNKSRDSAQEFYTFTTRDSDQASKQKGEMYFQCPKCGTYERVNNIGKTMIASDPDAFTSIDCVNCKHNYNARTRLKNGNIPNS